MEEKKEVIVNDITEILNLIYVIRGKQVMLDSDLAMLYQVETKNLNKAMKRNEKRFPEEFCFQITKEEYEYLRFQFGTSSEKGGRRYLPYAFTEQGIAMLSAVLKSDVAIQVSIRIMNTFVEMRKYMASNMMMLDKVNILERQQLETNIQMKTLEEKTDARFEQVFDYISSHEESHQKIFFDGQIFDAFSFLTNLVQQAEKSIILIDGYVDVTSFNLQYGTVDVKRTNSFHDRFLILDELVGYHIGASLKDAGKKCFGINEIEDVGVVKDLIQRAVLSS